MKVIAYAASIGHSVWFSDDLGESWARAHTHSGGIYNESRCWCVSTHPDRPGEVLSGTDQGLYRWHPALRRWVYVPSPLDCLQIVQLAQSPDDPDVIVAGTRPAHIFISRDGGREWERAPLANNVECEFINTPRVTSIQFDPLDAAAIWVTIEIDAIYRSRDGGRSWDRLAEGLLTEDTHSLLLIDQAGPRRILVSTEEGLHRSDDGGDTFRPVRTAATRFRYFRVLARRADESGVLFLSAGDRPSGETGELLRSRDFGENWERIALPGRVNSTIWSIGTNRADPDLIFFCTIMGQIWRSRDGGETWCKLERELGELRQIAWSPVP